MRPLFLISRKYGVLVGESTAERIRKVGCATPESEDKSMEIREETLLKVFQIQSISRV